jgi:hypothetical protein
MTSMRMARLHRRTSVALPVNVQYAWPHASDATCGIEQQCAANGPVGTDRPVHAFTIDAASGALAPHGQPVRLPTRPIT